MAGADYLRLIGRAVGGVAVGWLLHYGCKAAGFRKPVWLKCLAQYGGWLVLWGYVFGGIPALLTGLLSMRLRLHRTAKGVACAVVAGAVLSLLWFVVINWDVSTLYSSPQTLLMKMPVIMSCGAASSLILSAFLPKPQLQ